MTKGKVEEIFEVPSEALEKGVEMAGQAENALIGKRPLKEAEDYWQTLGPGLTTGAADDDPSGIATYSQAGAQYGFSLLWLAPVTFPLMATVQEMCARIGLVTGEGLAANIRRRYSPAALYSVAFLLFAANTINIAADLSAMAAATRLLLPSVNAITLVAAFALVSLLLQVFTTYARYARFLKYLTFALLSYVIVALTVQLDWGEVLYHTVVPTLALPAGAALLVCAVLGTTISPYLFFWQTAQEIEEDIMRGEKTVKERRREANPRSMGRMRLDVWTGMFLSNLVMFFIIAACAGTLYVSGVTNIETADQAALALKPFGALAYWLFAAGIVGTGLLAIPVLAASSAYTFAEAFKWRAGLYLPLKKAHAFYGVIIVAMVLGIGANIVGIDPIKGLIFAAVANAIIAPPVLFFIMRLADDKAVMGRYKNGRVTSAIGWLTTLVMAITSLVAIWTFL